MPPNTKICAVQFRVTRNFDKNASRVEQFFKKANKRNLVKRRMRAAYNMIKQKLQSTNKDKLLKMSVLIWIAHPPIASATFEQIKDSMERLLNKL